MDRAYTPGKGRTKIPDGEEFDMFGGEGTRAGTHMGWERDRFTRLRLPSPDLWVCFLHVMWL